MPVLDIDIDEFEAWLKCFRPDAVVGFSCSVDDCPLARYSGTRVCNLNTRGWARLFMREVDAPAVKAFSEVTASRALEILQKVRQ